MTKSQALLADSKPWVSAGSECTTSYKQTVVYTTFVETDTNNFRELVQKLTGVSGGEQVSVTVPAKKSPKYSPKAGSKSDRSFCAVDGSGIEVGIPPQKSAFKLHHKKQFQRRLEIKPDRNHDPDYSAILSGGKNHVVSSPTLIPSPITPLGPADPFTCSSSYYCYSSTPTSCNQSSHLEEKLCFQDSAISVKSEPELLPLFPLQSSTQPNTRI